MWAWIKEFLEMPKGGIKNISEFGAWFKTKWWQLLLIIGGILLLVWLVVKTIKWIISIFRD